MECGTYGTCAVCGKAIAPERLEALPDTAWCVDDAKNEERK
jgi:RNA polymerase-binding transcription factor DksA